MIPTMAMTIFLSLRVPLIKTAYKDPDEPGCPSTPLPHQEERAG